MPAKTIVNLQVLLHIMPTFKCPHCELPLALNGRSYRCQNNHTYDIAREGYVNLLLSQHKKSRNPGDSKEMINSRQRFLNKGYYQILADAVAELVSADDRVLDIGCGEGYYLAQLRQARPSLQLAGIDMSKTAVRLAAKRKMDAQLSNCKLAVISAYALPFFDGVFETAVSIFSPISPAETARVLVENGRLLMVGPGEEHLRGLAEQIYDEIVPHEGNHSLLDEAPEFKLQSQQEIKETITVAGEDVHDLLMMTPYYWHSKPEQQEKLANLSQLETTIHFYINEYRRSSLQT